MIKTNNQRKAYRAAYPSSVNWTDATVDSKASNFMKTDKVLARLEELRQEAAEESKISRKDLIDQVKSIAYVDLNYEAIKPSDKLKALELMARMLGYDKPETKSADGMLDQLIEDLKKI